MIFISHSGSPTSNVYYLRNLLVVLLWIFGIASRLAYAGPIPSIGVPPPGRVNGGTGSMFLSESQHGHAKYRISHGGDVNFKVGPDSFDQRVQEFLKEFNPSLVVALDREYVLGKPREPDHDGYVHCEVMGIANPQVFYRVKLKPNHRTLDGVVESGRTGRIDWIARGTASPRVFEYEGVLKIQVGKLTGKIRHMIWRQFRDMPLVPLHKKSRACEYGDEARAGCK
ncbi:hypothetical protein EV360DRAFT_68841 [Lentinula raphanica]|nr:hypothetical protein EV360DRAFT_68841 [Lentinula raphanica]